jgi:transcriptional regulator with XRE-family HTH domain
MQDSVLSIFAKRIRDIREDADLNQKDVASALNVSYKTFGRYERGETEPQVKFIADFCRHFGVSADYLLGLTDTRPDADVLSARFKRTPLDNLTGDEEDFLISVLTTLRSNDKNKKNRTTGA